MDHDCNLEKEQILSDCIRPKLSIFYDNSRSAELDCLEEIDQAILEDPDSRCP